MAKWQSADEWRLVRETERVMDVELFLGLQEDWAEDSPHHLVILHEMFQHAAIQGQKEAEQFIHRGCWQNMPQLNPEVGVPTVQLVEPGTTKEELLEIYLEVYKLHWLPGSPPGKPAILEEIMASVPGHPGREGDATHEATMQPLPRGSNSSRSRAPHQERRNNLIDKSLATVHNAHQKALAAVATLEEEINRLSRTWAHSKSWARSKTRDHQRPSGEGWKKRHHQVRFEDEATTSQSTDPKTPPGGDRSEGGGSDLEELPELKPMVASFL